MHISPEHHAKPLGKPSPCNQGKLHSYQHIGKASNVLSILASGLSIMSQSSSQAAASITTPRQETIVSQSIHYTQLSPGPGSQQRSMLDFYYSSKFLKIHIVVTGHVASTWLHFLPGNLIMGVLREF